MPREEIDKNDRLLNDDQIDLLVSFCSAQAQDEIRKTLESLEISNNHEQNLPIWRNLQEKIAQKEIEEEFSRIFEVMVILNHGVVAEYVGAFHANLVAQLGEEGKLHVSEKGGRIPDSGDMIERGITDADVAENKDRILAIRSKIIAQYQKDCVEFKVSETIAKDGLAQLKKELQRKVAEEDLSKVPASSKVGKQRRKSPK